LKNGGLKSISKKNDYDERINEKVDILLKSIETVCSILPSLSLFKKDSYDIEYKIIFDHAVESSFLNDKITKRQNFCTDTNSLHFNIDCVYINKFEIFQIKESIKDNQETYKRRPRFYSEGNDTNEFEYDISSFMKVDYDDNYMNLRAASSKITDENDSYAQLRNKNVTQSSLDESCEFMLEYSDNLNEKKEKS